MSDLAGKQSVPCQGGVPPLDARQQAEFLGQLDGWNIERGHHLTKTYTFRDFSQGLAFVNRVGAMADQQGHHPDIVLTWGKVRVDIWTHKIDGLTESDFVFAAKTDQCK